MTARKFAAILAFLALIIWFAFLQAPPAQAQGEVTPALQTKAPIEEGSFTVIFDDKVLKIIQDNDRGIRIAINMLSGAVTEYCPCAGFETDEGQIVIVDPSEITPIYEDRAFGVRIVVTKSDITTYCICSGTCEGKTLQGGGSQDVTTPVATSTDSKPVTPRVTMTSTPTTGTKTATATLTVTATATPPTETPTASPTTSPTNTPSKTASPTVPPTETPSQTPTASPTGTPSPTSTPSATPSATATCPVEDCVPRPTPKPPSTDPTPDCGENCPKPPVSTATACTDEGCKPPAPPTVWCPPEGFVIIAPKE